MAERPFLAPLHQNAAAELANLINIHKKQPYEKALRGGRFRKMGEQRFAVRGS